MRWASTKDRVLKIHHSRLHHSGSQEGGEKETWPRQGTEDARLGKEIEVAQKSWRTASDAHSTMLAAKWIFETIQGRLIEATRQPRRYKSSR